MDTSLPRAAETVLDRHPSPAVRPDELKAMLEAGPPGGAGTAGEDRIVRELRSGPTEVRVLLRPRRRWAAGLGPPAWILAGPGERRGDHPRRSVRGRLRSTLRELGRAVEPGSAPAWARWTRLVEEERRVRRALESRRRRLRKRRVDRDGDA